MATAAPSASGRVERPARRRARTPMSWRAFLAPALVLPALLTACGGPTVQDEQVALQAALDTPTAPSPEPAAPRLAAEPAPSETLIESEPDEHSEVGSLVAGFPVDLLPIPADAVILVTSAVPVGAADVQEVSLNLRTAMPTEELVDLYRDSLVAAGFEEVSPEVPSAELVVETTFTRSGGDELVSIGILDSDKGRTVTLGGRLHTGG